jgi:predicted RNase H-like HicB family nuclease
MPRNLQQLPPMENIRKYRRMNVLIGKQNKVTHNFTAYIEKDPESGMYVGTVPALPGAHTFAETLDDLRDKLVEVITLCLEEMDREEINALPVFTGITQVEVAV